MRKARRSKGFTLIELLIVITVIGILSGSMMLTSMRAMPSWSCQNARSVRNMAKTPSLFVVPAASHAGHHLAPHPSP